MFEIRDLHVTYGAVEAVRGISLTVEDGSIVALMGANGAGKSSTLKCITGQVRPARGEILWDGRSLAGMSAVRIARQGVACVPEGRGIFGDLTVLDNLRLGAYRLRGARSLASKLDAVYEFFPILRDRRDQIAGTLSGGEQQMMVIGRALMAEPRLLLLDEPSLGLAPKIVDQVYEIVADICRRLDLSALVIEQDASIALSICSSGYVLRNGMVAVRGTRDELMNDAAVRDSYLGA